MYALILSETGDSDTGASPLSPSASAAAGSGVCSGGGGSGAAAAAGSGVCSGGGGSGAGGGAGAGALPLDRAELPLGLGYQSRLSSAFSTNRGGWPSAPLLLPRLDFLDERRLLLFFPGLSGGVDMGEFRGLR